MAAVDYDPVILRRWRLATVATAVLVVAYLLWERSRPLYEAGRTAWEALAFLAALDAPGER